MFIEKKDEGNLLVDDPNHPDWGSGKIIKVDGNWVSIRFKNITSPEPKEFFIPDNSLIRSDNQDWLRDYQKKIYYEVLDLKNKGVRTVLLQAPTGAGKTAIMAFLAKEAELQSFSTWFIVHRRELIDQSKKAFVEEGIYAGVICAGHEPTLTAKTQICSLLSLKSRIDKYKTPDIVCFDECHHLPAKAWTKIYKAFPDAFILGLTATPERLDGLGLGDYFKNMVHAPTVIRLTELGYLSPYRLFARKGIDVTGVRTEMGDYVLDDLAIAADKPMITGDAIREYLKLGKGKRAIVFCASIEHSKHVAEAFNDNDVSAEHVDGNTPIRERDMAIKRFKTGKTLVLSNVDLFGEGFDLPEIEVAILLRPTKSLGLYLQQVGRSLRIADGKIEAIILDHAGNCERHGLPDDKREWSLDGRVVDENRSVITTRICPSCNFVQNFGRPDCKNCGHVFSTEPRKIKHIDGDLVEVNKNREPSVKKITEAPLPKNQIELDQQLEQQTLDYVNELKYKKIKLLSQNKYWEGWVSNRTFHYQFGRVGGENYAFSRICKSNIAAFKMFQITIEHYFQNGYKEVKSDSKDLATSIREDVIPVDNQVIKYYGKNRNTKRLFEFAKELGLPTDQVLMCCRELGFALPNQLAMIDKNIEMEVRKKLGYS